MAQPSTPTTITMEPPPSSPTTITTAEAPPSPPPPPLTTTPTPPVKPETTDSVDPVSIPSPSPPSSLTVPSYSRWFSWHSIHDTERRSLPEFFDGRSPSRNPETYRYYRDSIVRQCWESPTRRITFTDARRRLIGDAGSVRRVFDFLEQWGLVNYVPVKRSSPPPMKKVADEEQKAVAVEEQKAAVVRKVCTSCSIVCRQACFASHKQADVILCAKCFVRGNYRGGLTSGDFKRVDIAEDEGTQGKDARSDWSEKETLHLLEAVLHYGDDWKKVADHVGNGKSQMDCVARFVKLPFGEQFMGSLGGRMGRDCCRENEGGIEIESTSVDELHAAKRMRLTPLADASNPIMAQVAFLSAIAGSEVAEAAARAAIEALYDLEDDSLHFMKASQMSNSMGGELADESTDAAMTGKAFEDAVAEARLLLEKEQQVVEQSISDIVEIQMKEMQEKVLHFEEMELLVEKERSQVEYLKNVLFADQLGLLQQKARYDSVANGFTTN